MTEQQKKIPVPELLNRSPELVSILPYVDEEDVAEYKSSCTKIESTGTAADKQKLKELQDKIYQVSQDLDRKHQHKRLLIVALLFRVVDIENKLDVEKEARDESPIGTDHLKPIWPTPKGVEMPIATAQATQQKADANTPEVTDAKEREHTMKLAAASYGRIINPQGVFSDFMRYGESGNVNLLMNELSLPLTENNNREKWEKMNGHNDRHSAMLLSRGGTTMIFVNLYRFYENHNGRSAPGGAIRFTTNFNGIYIHQNDIKHLYQDGFLFNSSLAINNFEDSLKPDVVHKMKREITFHGAESVKYWPLWQDFSKWLQDDSFCYEFSRAIYRLSGLKKKELQETTLNVYNSLDPQKITEAQKTFLVDILELLILQSQEKGNSFRPLTWQSEEVPVNFPTMLTLKDSAKRDVLAPKQPLEEELMQALRECFTNLDSNSQILGRLELFKRRFAEMKTEKATT